MITAVVLGSVYATGAITTGIFVYLMAGMGEFSWKEKAGIGAVWGLLWPVYVVSFVVLGLRERLRSKNGG